MNFDENINNLDTILKDKNKRKSPQSKETIRVYMENWLDLANGIGLNNDVIQYFYRGYTIIGPETFKKYIDMQGDNTGALVKLLLAHPIMEKNVDASFKIATGLLAVLLNDGEKNLQALRTILTRYLGYCYNKEGLLACSAPTSFKRYMLDKINPDEEFVDIEKLNLSPALRKDIFKIYKQIGDELLEDMTNREDSNYNKIMTWLGEGVIAQTDIGKTKDASVSSIMNDLPFNTAQNAVDDNAVKQECQEMLLGYSDNFVKIAKELQINIEEERNDINGLLKLMLSKTQRLESIELSLFNLKNQYENLVITMSRVGKVAVPTTGNTQANGNQNTNIYYVKELESEKQKVFALEETIKNYAALIRKVQAENNAIKERNEYLTTQVAELRNKLSHAEEKLSDIDGMVKPKDEEIKRLQGLIEILENKTRTETEQSFNKTANNLRPVYRDYLELKKQANVDELSNMAMLVLDDLFNRLEKEGINIK